METIFTLGKWKQTYHYSNCQLKEYENALSIKVLSPMTSDESEKFISKIKKITKFEHLLLENADSLMGGVCQLLKESQQYQTLTIKGKINDVALTQLSTSLVNLSIKGLKLTGGSLDDNDFALLLQNSIKRKEPMVLNLAKNNLTDRCVEILTDQLKLNPNGITGINLQNNPLSNKGYQGLAKLLNDRSISL